MRIFNRRAKRDYQLLEKLQAGISLLGPEVKSIREGKMSLEEAFVRIKGGQAYLFNAHIHPYRFASPPAGGLDPTRARRLLLHKQEILALEQKMKQKNLTMVPLACYTKGRKIKLEIALAKGKRAYEHKEAIKRRDLRRETEIELKTRG